MGGLIFSKIKLSGLATLLGMSLSRGEGGGVTFNDFDKGFRAAIFG